MSEPTEFEELNDILSSSEEECSPTNHNLRGHTPDCAEPATTTSDKKAPSHGKHVQWTSPDGVRYFAAGRTVGLLEPGVYSINTCDAGLYFENVPAKIEDLIRFPDSNGQKIINEIQTFWTKEDRYAKLGIPYKRGILMWGPQGTGKSSNIQILIADVISMGGVVLKFQHPEIFGTGFRMFREIQPETPVIALMEDIDAILDRYSESSVLNLLDGIDSVHKVVFLASTNYPEKLGARIVNRPGRFDKRFKIGPLNEECRRMYVQHLSDKWPDIKVDVEQIVKDTEKFSIAHIKELFTAVYIYENEYEEAVETMRSMKQNISSTQDPETSVGFKRG